MNAKSIRQSTGVFICSFICARDAYDCGRSEETHIDPGLIHTYQHHDLSGWLQGSKALLIQSCVRTGCGILWVCCVGACEGDVMGDRLKEFAGGKPLQ